jgi:hypothetical protein
MTVADCGHTGDAGLICSHMQNAQEKWYILQFTGVGSVCHLTCEECGPVPVAELRSACRDCWMRIVRENHCIEVRGTPQVIDRAAGYTFAHRAVGPIPLPHRVHDWQPLRAEDRQRWLTVDAAGRVCDVDLDTGDVRHAATIADGAVPRFDDDQTYSLVPSADGRFAAVVNHLGPRGVVLDLTTGAVTMRLDRGDYHHDVTKFSLAFFELDGRTLLIHASDWNRLDVSDPATGELLTPRELPARGNVNDPRPNHYLDYFHSGLVVSPDGKWVADNGWAWHPVGILTTWDIRRWVTQNVWESEDGPTRRELCDRDVWDRPVCWIAPDRLAMWGYGRDEQWMLSAVVVFDVTTGKELTWFPGPSGELAFDGELFSFDAEGGTSVWDVATGERLHRDADLRPTRYHPGAKTFLTPMPDGRFRISRLVRPAAPELRGETVRALARTIHAGRRWDLMPILADALEEAGWSDVPTITHCRAPGSHGHHCWVVDSILAESLG